jgi:hypothetical protein
MLYGEHREPGSIVRASRAMSQPSTWYSLDWEARAEPGGDSVGPVSLETVQGWLETKSLGNRAELRKLGTTEWLRARTVLATTQALPSDAEFSGQNSSLPPRLPRPRRMFVAGGALGVAALATVLVVGYRAHWLERWRSSRALPIAAARLPGRTVLVSEARLEPNLDEFAELPPEYGASALAEFACGGVSLTRLLRASRDKDLAWLQERGLLDLLQNDAWRDALTCGDTVRKTLTAVSVGRVSFNDADKVLEVGLLRTSGGDLPGKWLHHTFSGFAGQCERPKDASNACQPGGHATFYDAPLRVVGDLDAVESFAHAYASVREDVSTNVEILDELIKLSGKSDVTTLTAKPEHVDFEDVCRRAAPVESSEAFIKACFPDGQATLIASIETKVRGLAVEQDFLTRNRVRWSKVLLARDEEAATSIEKDLIDLVRDWRSQLENNEPQLIKIYREPSTFVHDDLMRSVLDPFLRALRGMKVERHGQVVRLLADEELRPEESKTIHEFSETRRTDQSATLEIIDALLAKTPPPASSLAVFVGPEAAAWIVAPRAREEDCAALAAKLHALSSGELPPELFGAKFRLERQLTGSTCVGKALPADVKGCFLSSASLADFAKCKLPASPFVFAATSKLIGQWQVKPSADMGATEVALLKTCRLEFSETTTAFGCGAGRWTTALLVESSSSDVGSVALPFAKGIETHDFAFQKDGGLEIEKFAGAINLKFERAKFDSMLTAKPNGGT